MRETDLYVIGDVNPDILVVDDDAVPEFGQVEKLVGTIRLTVGGSSAITACGAARLGLRVAHGGIVGDDLLGRAIRDALADHGVDVSTIVVDPAIPTGATVVLGRGDHRALLTAVGTIDRLRAEDVPRRVLPHDPPSARGLDRDPAALASRACPTCSPRPGGPVSRRRSTPTGTPSAAGADIDHLLAATDVFFPNEREAVLITGRSDPLEAAHELVRRATTAGRVADGGTADRGASSSGRRAGWPSAVDEALRLPAPRGARSSTRPAPATRSMRASSAACSTAAPSAECLALAVACGSLSTRAIGGVDGQATLEEAEALL